MDELSKILQEIEKEATRNPEIGCKQAEGMARAMDIIRKHLPDNDGWIPVEERLPETNIKVDITFKEWIQYSKKYIYKRCNAVYISEKTILAEDMWNYYDADTVFDYDEKTEQFFVKEGWYETVENWDEYSHILVLGEVVAWRPLPKPYRAEKGE